MWLLVPAAPINFCLCVSSTHLIIIHVWLPVPPKCGSTKSVVHLVKVIQFIKLMILYKRQSWVASLRHSSDGRSKRSWYKVWWPCDVQIFASTALSLLISWGTRWLRHSQDEVYPVNFHYPECNKLKHTFGESTLKWKVKLNKRTTWCIVEKR